MKEMIFTDQDVLVMLDELLKEKSRFDWNTFYSDREREVPIFVNHPDENLVQYLQERIIVPGKALDLGCGAGRNAMYLAEKGCV
ncbi:hypothetical protein JOC77_000846 [Peribacillus deserti]|uniref:Tellurite resistance methyltransferase TehB-like domain-containing protein n=1 Tax=Peribacillus deserti TaxID=673318 RepID=A0ABS2QE60_9BACI|nr:hypothetical protein [Peribacillus deserti]